jgi:hypothetical protein
VNVMYSLVIVPSNRSDVACNVATKVSVGFDSGSTHSSLINYDKYDIIYPNNIF